MRLNFKYLSAIFFIYSQSALATFSVGYIAQDGKVFYITDIYDSSEIEVVARQFVEYQAINGFDSFIYRMIDNDTGVYLDTMAPSGTQQCSTGAPVELCFQKEASNIPPAEPALASGSFAEPSDTPEQAVPVLVNDTPQYQLLDDRGGDDWFEFYAEQGTRYTIRIPADSIGSAINPGLELYDEFGNLLALADSAGSVADTQIVWTATETGLFRARVFDQGLAARKANPALDYAYQMRVFLTDAPQQGLIKGFVRDTCQQIGINKAAVSAWAGGSLRDSSFTHKTGEFGIPVDPGAYDVKGSASQYQEKQRNVSVAQVQASRADFELSPQSSCEQTIQTLDPVLQSQQAVATYDEHTGLLIIKDVWAKGYTYYAELQEIGGYRFQLMDAIALSGTIHAPTGTYSFDTFQADFPSVYAFGKTFKVQMQNDGAWLFDLTNVSEAE